MNSRTAPAAPDLADILLRLDAHGYAKSGTRQKGITTLYRFRDYSGRSDETGGEIELAEELPERYGDLEAPWLGARLRALGVPTAEQRKRRVDGEQINRAGVALSDLRRALEGPTG